MDEKKQEEEHSQSWKWMSLHDETKELRHRDAFGRILKIAEDDDREYRIRPDDGKLELLEVSILRYIASVPAETL